MKNNIIILLILFSTGHSSCIELGAPSAHVLDLLKQSSTLYLGAPFTQTFSTAKESSIHTTYAATQLMPYIGIPSRVLTLFMRHRNPAEPMLSASFTTKQDSHMVSVSMIATSYCPHESRTRTEFAFVKDEYTRCEEESIVVEGKKPFVRKTTRCESQFPRSLFVRLLHAQHSAI